MEQPAVTKRWDVAWIVAATVPSVFVSAFLFLILFGTPEHDDYCFAYGYASVGFVSTLQQFYTGLSGRVTSLAVLQLPQALASSLSINLLSAYPLVLAIVVAVFTVGSAVAIRTAWCVRGLRLFALTATFVASVIAVAPSPHELLYWFARRSLLCSSCDCGDNLSRAANAFGKSVSSSSNRARGCGLNCCDV